eukprot:366080-Chlamydomonas_euryale.AAC.11
MLKEIPPIEQPTLCDLPVVRTAPSCGAHGTFLWCARHLRMVRAAPSCGAHGTFLWCARHLPMVRAAPSYGACSNFLLCDQCRGTAVDLSGLASTCSPSSEQGRCSWQEIESYCFRKSRHNSTSSRYPGSGTDA